MKYYCYNLSRRIIQQAGDIAKWLTEPKGIKLVIPLYADCSFSVTWEKFPTWLIKDKTKSKKST